MKIGDKVKVRTFEEIRKFFGFPSPGRDLIKYVPNAKHESSIFVRSMKNFCEGEFEIVDIVKGLEDEYDCIYLDMPGSYIYFIEPWLRYSRKDNNGQILLDL